MASSITSQVPSVLATVVAVSRVRSAGYIHVSVKPDYLIHKKKNLHSLTKTLILNYLWYDKVMKTNH